MSLQSLQCAAACQPNPATSVVVLRDGDCVIHKVYEDKDIDIVNLNSLPLY